MSLSSAAHIAQSGLSTLAAETSILSRNISGASGTSVFSRKIPDVIATPDGARMLSVTRASNLAVFEDMLSATSANASQDALASGLDTLNQSIGDVTSSGADTGSNISPAALLSGFTNALQEYEASPSNATLASAAVDAAATLARGLNNTTTTVSQLRAEADSQIATSVQTINSLLGHLQTVNRQIVNGTATGADVTDAQDNRDNILTKLATELGITTVTGASGDMSVYTDGGVTLFQGGVARAVTFQPANTYTPATTGGAVSADGVPITGLSAAMPLEGGRLAGLSTLRDNLAVTYQAQLDGIAGALIASFAERDQVGSGPALPGLFTIPGAASLPAGTTGLAGQIEVNPNVDPDQAGNPLLLRDGGISGQPGYSYNLSGDASYQDRLSQLLANVAAPQPFNANGGIGTGLTLAGYASASVGWLETQRSDVASRHAYQSTLLSTATTALSNATGVNLDDEMSKMLDLERSYSATAKLIAAIDTMFASLLANLGPLSL